MKKSTKKIISFLAAVTIVATCSFTALAADEVADETKTTVTTTEETAVTEDKTATEEEATEEATEEEATDEEVADEEATVEETADDETATEAIDYTQFDAEGIDVVVFGKKLEFDVQPDMVNDRVMVPLRAIFEAIGATVQWDDETQTITAVKDQTAVIMQIGNTKMFVDGKECAPLDAAPMLKDDSRTLVPIRAISEAFGCDVQWVDETEMVIISEAKVEEVVDETKTEEVADETKTEEAADETKTEEVVDETKAEEVVDETKAEEVVDETKTDDKTADDDTKTK